MSSERLGFALGQRIRNAWRCCLNSAPGERLMRISRVQLQGQIQAGASEDSDRFHLSLHLYTLTTLNLCHAANYCFSKGQRSLHLTQSASIILHVPSFAEHCPGPNNATYSGRCTKLKQDFHMRELVCTHDPLPKGKTNNQVLEDRIDVYELSFVELAS